MSFLCTYCGKTTQQSPGAPPIFTPGDEDLIYPPCCYDCVRHWRPAARSSCTPEVLAQAAAADAQQLRSIAVQHAAVTILLVRRGVRLLDRPAAPG